MLALLPLHCRTGPLSGLDAPMRRLQSQLVASFLISYLAIALAIGLPLLLLINRQASSQAHLVLQQAVLSSQALLAGEQADLENLSLLVSQRPTLASLLEKQDLLGINAYLKTLQDSTGLDLLVVCAGQAPLPTEDDPAAAALCLAGPDAGYAPATGEQDLLLFRSTPLPSTGGEARRIIAAKRLSSVLAELQAETGLLYLLARQGRIVFSSSAALDVSQAATLSGGAAPAPGSSLTRQAITLGEHDYLLASLNILMPAGTGLFAALNVDQQIAMQRQLSWTIVIDLLGIILAASLLGLALSRRISRPIVDLAAAAGEFRHGRLDVPVSVGSPVSEISQLADTLEDARVALQHSLHQLQAKTEWNQHLLDSIAEALVTVDSQDRITFASAGLSRILEGAPGGVIGRRIDEVFLPADGELPFRSQLPEAGQQRRVAARLADGRHKLLSISKAALVPPEAGDADRALVIRDVSSEEYIHRFMGDFLANITHEFRTPLAALEASSELLLDNLTGLTIDETRELLRSLNLGIINLQTLIDNLIEAASIEAGRFKVSIQPVPFDDILADALKIMMPLAEMNSLKISISPPEGNPPVMADYRRTVQVLVNLLSNAIKHSPSGASIRITCERRGPALEVQVIDQGDGVTPGLRGDLFRRFARGDAIGGRARQGAGLGLSVVKAIVEAQQGQVGIKDQPPPGSSFWFTLPLAPEAK